MSAGADIAVIAGAKFARQKPPYVQHSAATASEPIMNRQVSGRNATEADIYRATMPFCPCIAANLLSATALDAARATEPPKGGPRD